MRRPPSTTVAALLVVAVIASATTAGVAAAGTDARTAQSTTPAGVDGPPEANATVDAWRVPERADPANASVETLREYSTNESTTNVTPHDRLVLDVAVPGLDARVANASGNASANLTAGVLAALDSSGYLVVRQTLDSTSPEVSSRSLWLNATNVQVRDVAGEDRYLLVVDPERVLGVHGSTFEAPSTVADEHRDDDYRFDGLFEHGLIARDVYTARYYANESESALVATSRGLKFRPAATILDATGPLEPVTNANVAGTTTVAPGTELVVSAQTAAGDVVSATTTVHDDGRFRATLDLATVDAPATVNVTVAASDDQLRPLVVEPSTLDVSDPNASVGTENDTTTPPTTTTQTAPTTTPSTSTRTSPLTTTGITTGPWTTATTTSVADDPVPGFGVPVALAAVAALLGALSVRRRREN